MPLMGWLSAADTLSQVSNTLHFESKEEAIRVAERNGVSWTSTRSPLKRTLPPPPPLPIPSRAPFLFPPLPIPSPPVVLGWCGCLVMLAHGCCRLEV